MTSALAIPSLVPDLAPALNESLHAVAIKLHAQLRDDVPEVQRLLGHVERYRGKMLRPTLAILSAMAARESDGFAGVAEPGDEAVTVAAVVEMIHLATLVHDDVLDAADTRRGGPSVNKLNGNEIAVVLGDYLISQAFHLCSTLSDQRTALRVGEVTTRVCAGEMLQLSRRGDAALDERTYFDIIERKTAALIAVACELGGLHGGADAGAASALYRFGEGLGVAFQIQDDLLDLVGDESVVGKPLGKDVEKGKVTLPILHYLSASGSAPAEHRDELREMLRLERPLNGRRGKLIDRLREAGSLDYARRVARERVEAARGELGVLPAGPARDQLDALAGAVIARDR